MPIGLIIGMIRFIIFFIGAQIWAGEIISPKL